MGRNATCTPKAHSYDLVVLAEQVKGWCRTCSFGQGFGLSERVGFWLRANGLVGVETKPGSRWEMDIIKRG